MQPQTLQYVKTCPRCQLMKKQRKKYGKISPKEAEETPWKHVNVDLVGPYSIRTTDTKHKLQLRAMTMIDPATSWFKMAPIVHPDSNTTQTMFDAYWLARYPRPEQIVGYDNGGEFKWLFKELCENVGIKKKPSNEYNPQSNSILERVHQVVGNCLQTFALTQQETSREQRIEVYKHMVKLEVRALPPNVCTSTYFERWLIAVAANPE